MQFMNDSKWVSPFDSLIPLLVVFLFLALTLPAHAETVQSYPNLPGAVPDNAFASAPLLDSTVVVPLIGETRLEIPAPTAEALASKAANQIGVAVEIPAEQRGLPSLMQDSAWTKVGEHRYARLTLRSVGAVSVRAGVAIPDGFPGRVLSVSGSGVVESELKRGDQLAWSAIAEGDTLTLLVEIPAGYRFHEGDLAVPVVSHIDSDPLAAAGNGFANIYPTTSSCTIDLACAKTSVQQAAGASVMKIVYTKDGKSYSCSGNLLADSARSYKPYVYTASHCIGTQAIADSVITYWNLQYPICTTSNSGTPAGVIKLSKGAQLLHGNADNDHALLLLKDTPPAEATFLGWSSDALTSGADVAIIGHPMGDVKKIAFGSTSNRLSSPFISSDWTFHSGAWNVNLTQGVVQPGASGGGLVTCDALSCYLRGGLLTAADSTKTCSLTQKATASRFDAAFRSLKQWLGIPVPTALTFSGWPTTMDSNATVPVGQITVLFSNEFNKSAGTLVTSSNPELVWIKDSAIVTGTATADTAVTLTATYTENGTTVTGYVPITVKAAENVAKTAPTAITDTAKTSNPLDCLFAWAEKTHPDLFAPGGGATGTLGAYRYRHYPATSAYLGLSSDNDHFYYLGPSTSNRLMDLGAASTWYATAGCR